MRSARPPQLTMNAIDWLGRHTGYESLLRGLRTWPPPPLSCAIVGGGSGLYGKQLGAQIDGHDVVVRVNRLLAGGNATHDFGSRTDVWFSKLCRIIPHPPSLELLGHDGSEGGHARHVACPFAGGTPASRCPFRAFVVRGGADECGGARVTPIIAPDGAVAVRPNGTHSAGAHSRTLLTLGRMAANPHADFAMGIQSARVYGHARRLLGFENDSATNHRDATTGFLALTTFREVCGTTRLYGFTGNGSYDGHRISSVNHALDLEHERIGQMAGVEVVT